MHLQMSNVKVDDLFYVRYKCQLFVIDTSPLYIVMLIFFIIIIQQFFNKDFIDFQKEKML